MVITTPNCFINKKDPGIIDSSESEDAEYMQAVIAFMIGGGHKHNLKHTHVGQNC